MCVLSTAPRRLADPSAGAVCCGGRGRELVHGSACMCTEAVNMVDAVVGRRCVWLTGRSQLGVCASNSGEEARSVLSVVCL